MKSRVQANEHAVRKPVRVEKEVQPEMASIEVSLSLPEIYKRLQKILPGYTRIAEGVEANVEVTEETGLKPIKAYVRVVITPQGKGTTRMSVVKRHGTAKSVALAAAKILKAFGR